MKNFYLLLCLSFLLAVSNLHSQNDTLYIWKSGNIINIQSVKLADMDSITFYKPSSTICENVTDIDGNLYPAVTIGNKCWMQKNLNVSKYRNGDVIQQVTDPTSWENLTTGAWCYYENNTENGPVYGKLYNWYAVNDPRGLAPAGWHVPTDTEWTNLTSFLGGEGVAGGAMKDINGWYSPNTGATNSSGFTGIPGGFRDDYGAFGGIGNYGFWWSTTEFDAFDSWNRDISNDNPNTYRNFSGKAAGFSVRCIRD